MSQPFNLSRYVVENRPVAWVALVTVTLWGAWAYTAMPKRKDPYLPPRQVAIVTPWAGQSAERVEQLVTRKVEEQIARNPNVVEVKSTNRAGLSVVYAELDGRLKDIAKDLDDLKIKLDAIADLPAGAGPIQYIKDFGDTSALMLTVASPNADDEAVHRMAAAVDRLRDPAQDAVVLCSAIPIDRSHLSEAAMQLARQLSVSTSRISYTNDAYKSDCAVIHTASTSAALVEKAWQEMPQRTDLHPDIWEPVAVAANQPSAAAALAEKRSAKYSYWDLDDFSERLEKAIKTGPRVARVTRTGLVQQQVELLYSQERLASFGLTPAALPALLQARNSTIPAGGIVAGGRAVEYQPTNEFSTLAEIDQMTIAAAGNGTPVHLRELGAVRRGYEHPVRLLSQLSYRDANDGQWRHARAVTLSVEMKKGEQIDPFAAEVWSRVAEARKQLPGDLVIERTSDQQRQVSEKLDLFLRSLWEAVVLVVIVSWIGFWEWRSALLMALSIPTTIAMTFGLMHAAGLDIQQMSIASLIIALGLLVDDPVVAGDAIKRELGEGQPKGIAAWLGPTKLSRAILYATITNIAAYFPFLLLTEDVGRYVYSLPVTIACSLVASRIVSMTFIPLFAYYLLRPARELSLAEARQRGFGKWYRLLIETLIRHRFAALAASTSLLLVGGFSLTQLHDQFFPRENFYIAYVDIRLPDDAPITATQRTVEASERVAQRFSDARSKDREHPLIHSMTAFIGAGGPRFWFSVTPEAPAPNYAQLLVQFTDSEDTNRHVAELQEALSREVSSARIDVRTVETGPPTIIPISLRILGDDITILHQQANRLKRILATSPLAINIRDDWGTPVIRGHMEVDQDRAAMAGISGQDLAISSYSALRGAPVGALREGSRSLPIVQLLDFGQRADAESLKSLYVYSSQGPQNNVTLRQIANISYRPEPGVINRMNQHRAITVSALPRPGHIASEVTAPLMRDIRAFEQQLPPGYRLEIAGELKEQIKGQTDSAVVGLTSAAMIFLALVIQFRSAIKPVIVFSGIPFGAAGALAAVWLMNLPMGFLAILGITSLIGVIVSHVIVLFDFIEERHEAGEGFHEALIDAGILRIRPVLVTVGATLAALFPLAQHGGPLFEALCWAQIGGLTVATVISLVLVPVIYVIFVEDLKLVRWELTKEKS